MNEKTPAESEIKEINNNNNNNNNNDNNNNKWEEIIGNRLFVHNALRILLKQLNYQFLF